MNRFPEAYIDYLIYFHGERDYFECHEVLEDYWKENPDSPLSDTWVGLIQIAVGLYHERRNNVKGARKMIASALDKLALDDLTSLGIDGEKLLDLLKERLQQLHATEASAYVDIDIPLQDEALLTQCKAICHERHLVWGQQSDLSHEALIHKHKLRDRSEVIAERRAQLDLRMQQRSRFHS